MDDRDEFSIAMDRLVEQTKFFRKFRNYIAAEAFPDLRKALFEQMAVAGWSDSGLYSPHEAEARRRLRELLPILDSEARIGVRTWRIIAAELRLPIPDSRDLALRDAVAIGAILRHRPTPSATEPPTTAADTQPKPTASQTDRERCEFAKPHREKSPAVGWDRIAELWRKESGDPCGGEAMRKSWSRVKKADGQV